MCGIAGVLNIDGAPASRPLVAAMVNAVLHRGPDGTAIFCDGPVGLGSARLSIVDPDGGSQPMSSEDGGVTIVYNGEIYNHRELRQDLIGHGLKFKSLSDTEVVLKMYLKRGMECVHCLNGEWAFAIWDRARKRLFMARDRTGARPLYFAQLKNSLVFGSEIKAVLTHHAVPREINLTALFETFTFWAPHAPNTLFQSVQELEPGCSITIESALTRIHRYWSFDFSSVSHPSSMEDSSNTALALLDDAVERRLRADVPVASYVSGGIDSTFVTALAQRRSLERLQTYSVRFSDFEIDEGDAQHRVVSLLDTNHAELVCRSTDVFDALRQTVRHVEQPLLRTGPVPMYLLSKLVSDCGGRVVLTGEGADEIFGGYDLFKEAKLRAFVQTQPASRWRPLLFKRLYNEVPRLGLQPAAFLRAFFEPSSSRQNTECFASHLPRWRSAEAFHGLFAADIRPDFRRFQQNYLSNLLQRVPAGFAGWESLAKAQFLETMLFLPGYLLSSQCDRVSMAHGVETRLPYLDNRVVDFAVRLPPRMKMPALRDKYLLRQAAAKILPQDLCRQKKRPYRGPSIARLLGIAWNGRDGDTAGLLSKERLSACGLFDFNAVERLMRRVMTEGHSVSAREDMLLTGILTTVYLCELFFTDPIADAKACT